jgi:hypothetical protein
MICLRKVISFNLNICKQIYSLTKEMNVQKLSISKRGRLCAKLVFKRPAESTEVLLSFKFPLFVTLSAIAIILSVLKIIQFFRTRKDAFWDQPMGNYTFKELYNILLTQFDQGVKGILIILGTPDPALFQEPSDIGYECGGNQ